MKAYTISPNDSYIRLEVKYHQNVFNEENGHPHWFMTKVMNEVNRLNIPREYFQTINGNENWVTSKRTPISPDAGEKGC